MSIDYCHKCGKRVDTDYIDYQETGELLCNGCLNDMEGENEVETAEQLRAANKLEQCRRLIEQCGMYYSQTQDDIYRRIASETEQDVVYWQARAAGRDHETASVMAYGRIK